MSRPEHRPDRPAQHPTRHQTRYPPERPFDEPWHAQVFALAHALHDDGRFAWPEFSAALGAALREQPDYWTAWTTALERVAVDRGLTTGDALDDRRAAWRAAASATPHGTPITLDRPAGVPEVDRGTTAP